MKYLALTLGVIFALLSIATAAFFIGGVLGADLYVTSVDATNVPDAYASIRALVASDAVPQRFSGELGEDASGCTLSDVTITLNNHGFVSAQWVSVSAVPLEGDVAVYSVSGEGLDVPAHGSASVNLKLISTDPADAERVYIVEYYVWGMKRQIEVR